MIQETFMSLAAVQSRGLRLHWEKASVVLLPFTLSGCVLVFVQ